MHRDMNVTLYLNDGSDNLDVLAAQLDPLAYKVRALAPAVSFQRPSPSTSTSHSLAPLPIYARKTSPCQSW
jgi:hypothetical protein